MQKLATTTQLKINKNENMLLEFHLRRTNSRKNINVKCLSEIFKVRVCLIHVKRKKKPIKISSIQLSVVFRITNQFIIIIMSNEMGKVQL